MLNQLSIQELIASLERVDGQILIPDEDVDWLWDSIHHQFHAIASPDKALIRNCFESNAIRTETRQIPGENGPSQYIESIYIPIIRENGGGRLILKLSFDITEKVTAEQAISEERNKLAEITRNFPDAILTLDPASRIVSWNRGAESIFGYGESDILDRPVDVLFHAETPFEDTLASYVQGPVPTHPLFVRCVTQDGQELHCEVTFTLVRNERTGAQETVMTLRDRTRQKNLEDEIKRTLDNLSKINQISALVHATLNIDDIINMILVATTAGEGFRFNRAFLFLMNDDRTALIGQKAIGPSDPHEAGLLWSELSQKALSLEEILQTYKAAHGGKDFKVNQMIAALQIPLTEKDKADYLPFHHVVSTGEGLCIRSDSPFLTDFVRRAFETTHLAIVPLVSKQTLGIMVVDNSITGRAITNQDMETLKVFAYQISGAIENAVLYEKLQNKLEELEEAHQALQSSQEKLIRSEKLAAIGELSARMAHEIRNPLVAIGGFARMILDRKHLQQNEEYLRVILDEALRLERILNNTLTYARSTDPVKIRQPILPVLENALTLVRDRFDQANIDIIKDYAEPPPDVEFDGNQMMQALLNILINAAEAMSGGGQLFLRLWQDDAHVQLSIQDTGEGMDDDQLKKIFDPFYSTKAKGSGLGLVVVHDILERHGIEYSVHSKRQEGTTFVLRFLR